jgi:hypothetical protein
MAAQKSISDFGSENYPLHKKGSSNSPKKMPFRQIHKNDIRRTCHVDHVQGHPFSFPKIHIMLVKQYIIDHPQNQHFYACYTPSKKKGGVCH